MRLLKSDMKCPKGFKPVDVVQGVAGAWVGVRQDLTPALIHSHVRNATFNQGRAEGTSNSATNSLIQVLGKPLVRPVQLEQV